MRHFIPSPSDKYEFLRQKSLDPRLVSPFLPFVRDPKFPVDAPDPALRFARPIRLCLTRLACTASLVSSRHAPIPHSSLVILRADRLRNDRVLHPPLPPCSGGRRPSPRQMELLVARRGGVLARTHRMGGVGSCDSEGVMCFRWADFLRFQFFV